MKSCTRLSTALLLIALFLVAGCAESEHELLSNLDSREAIEATVLLHRAGIEVRSNKQSSGRQERFQLLVPKAFANKAMQMLYEYNIPRRETAQLEEMLNKQGFIPLSPELNSLKYAHAINLLVERQLLAFSGVVSVRANVRVVDRKTSGRVRLNSSALDESGASASVVIRYVASGAELPFDVDVFRRVVSQNVPGLAPERVEIILSRVEFTQSGIMSGVAAVASVPLVPFLLDVGVDSELVAAYRLRLLLVLLGFGLLFALTAYLFALNRRGYVSQKHPRSGTTGNFFIETSLEAGNAPTVSRSERRPGGAPNASPQRRQ